MSKNLRTIIASLVALLVCNVSAKPSTNWYMGLEGQTDLFKMRNKKLTNPIAPNVSVLSQNKHFYVKSRTGFGVFGGYTFNKFVSTELGFNRLNKTSGKFDVYDNASYAGSYLELLQKKVIHANLLLHYPFFFDQSCKLLAGYGLNYEALKGFRDETKLKKKYLVQNLHFGGSISLSEDWQIRLLMPYNMKTKLPNSKYLASKLSIIYQI